MCKNRLTILSKVSNEWTAVTAARLRFSGKPDGKDMTSVHFFFQQYVGFSTNSIEEDDPSEYTWVRIFGNKKSSFTAEKLVEFVRLSDNIAFWDSNDLPVTNEVIQILRQKKVANYQIRWIIEGEDTIQVVQEGTVPVYKGGEPYKKPTASTTFKFKKWIPEIVPANQDAQYTAEFDEEPRTYKITWISDGVVLKEEQVAYGVIPKWEGDVPQKAEDDQYTYAFSAWHPVPDYVAGDAEYTAQFTSVPISEWYMLTLSSVDGDANKEALQDALKTHSKVKLVQGSYPLAPSVTIKSGCILDLGDSVITSTAYKNNGGLICMEGKNPVIQNGEIAGLFDTPIYGLSDPNFFENERLIMPLSWGYENAKIENLKLHNCWGYAICEGGERPTAYRTVTIPDENINYTYSDDGTRLGSTVSQTAAGFECTSEELVIANIPDQFRKIEPPYSYVCAHYAGFFRIISEGKIKYAFTLNDNTEQTVEDWQGMPVEVPQNAVSVKVKLTWTSGYDKWKSYVDESGNRVYRSFTINFFNYAGGLNVKNCQTYYNASLGMTGGAVGVTTAENCQSWGNGKPYANPEVNNGNTTTGFIDIEDTPTPKIVLKDCISDDETNGAMLGAIRAEINNWVGRTLLLYRGLEAKITNSDATIGITTAIGKDDYFVKMPVTITNSTLRGSTGVLLPNTLQTKNCTFYNISTRQANDDGGIYIFTDTNATVGDLSGIKNLTVKSQYSDSSKSGLNNITAFSPSPNSSVTLLCNGSQSSGSASFYPIIATGDCNGITSDETVYPAGYTVKGSSFTPGLYVHPYKSNNMHGLFEHCNFNLANRAFYQPSLHVYGNKLTFKNCSIRNANHFLLGRYENEGYVFGFGRNNVFLFINCEYERKDSLVAARDNAQVGTGGYPTIVLSEFNVSVEADYTIVPGKGDKYSAVVTPGFGESLESMLINVTMGGIDITSSSYTSRSGEISISEVSGTIMIQIAKIQDLA